LIRLGATSILATEAFSVIAGIDTHADTHHVAVINEHGKPIADREFLAVGSGYRKIVDFITSHGAVTAVGVEGTGSYGAEIARTLRSAGLNVLEVNRPNRAARRLKGKSDPLDAYQAAQSVLDGRTKSIPKAKDGPVESLRILRAGRTSAVKARTAAINQIKGLLVSAPDKLRAKFRGLGTSAMITALHRTRPSGHLADPEYVCLLTLKALATRCHSLADEIATADSALHEILDTYAPMLCDLPGVGTEVASQLLVTVGDNADRLGNEAKFAALVGVAPYPHPRAKQPVTDSAEAATATPTTPCIRSSWSAWPRANGLKTTWPNAPRRAKASARSCAASNATQPGKSTARSPTPKQPQTTPICASCAPQSVAPSRPQPANLANGPQRFPFWSGALSERRPRDDLPPVAK
jgi:transposase